MHLFFRSLSKKQTHAKKRVVFLHGSKILLSRQQFVFLSFFVGGLCVKAIILIKLQITAFKW